MRATLRWPAIPLLLLVAAGLVLPVLAVLGSWLQWNTASAQILSEMAQTVLPEYALTSLMLCVVVAIGVALVGALPRLP